MQANLNGELAVFDAGIIKSIQVNLGGGKNDVHISSSVPRIVSSVTFANTGTTTGSATLTIDADPAPFAVYSINSSYSASATSINPLRGGTNPLPASAISRR